MAPQTGAAGDRAGRRLMKGGSFLCAFTGEGWRVDVQTKEAWVVGHAIGEVLGLDPACPREMARISGLLKEWLRTGVLKKVERTINAKGKTAPVVEVGRWAEV